MRQRSLVIALLAGALSVVPAHAAWAQGFGISSWLAGVYNTDYNYTNTLPAGGGQSSTGPNATCASRVKCYTQAAGHPYEGVTDFTVDNNNGVPTGTVSHVRVDIPPGLISNPLAVTRCTSATPSASSCPSSQVGLVQIEAYVTAGLGVGSDVWLGASVYDMVPTAPYAANDPSDYAFSVEGNRVDIVGGVCTGVDNGCSAADDHLYFTINVSQALPALSLELVRSVLIFFGAPGDTAHNGQLGWSCGPSMTPCAPPSGGGPSASPPGKWFISLPSGCVPPGQISTLALTDSSGNVAQSQSVTPIGATGCNNVPFNPSISLTPSTTQSDAPTGLTTDLSVDQYNEAANQLAASHLQTAVVTLPPGMTLDPSAANGLGACSAGEFGYGSDAPPTCPGASQLGTVRIDTPLLPNPLTGQVYLGCNGGSPTPCTPGSNGGLTTNLYVYATDPTDGITQKLVGTVTTDPATGQVTTTFANQPQVPFTDFILNLNGGPTASIANPLGCGPATTTSSLTPYSGNPAATPSTTFTVDSNGAGGACAQPAPFAPGLSVSTATRQAGAFDDPLTVTVTRADQQQYLGQITAQLPPGLVARLADVPECPDLQASAGDCPADSRIGHTTVLAGAGTDPVSQTGNVYLTGPYKGAPFGLSIVVPAIAGPFDLGTPVVRAAIEIDRTDAHVTVVSDPLPQIVGGVPLRLRSVAVTIDRPDFMINPTSCQAMAIGATIASAQGATAGATSPFQATGCGALPFTPTLGITLTGNRQTTVGGHPTLISTVRSGLGQANIRSASVTLPLSLALDPNNSQVVCSVAAANTDSCPASTAIGSATVVTPLLSQPLTGTVYLVQGIRYNEQGQPIRTLPALLIPLRGQVAIDLRAQTSVDNKSRLVTTFPTAPDAAISSFTITINGGRHGILVVTGNANLCKGRQVALATFGAQSGAGKSLSLRMGVPCAKPVSVKRLAVKGQLVHLVIAVPAKGTLRVGGAGLVTAVRRLRGARRVSLTLRPTRGETARLQRRGKLKLRLWIHYTPTGWPMQASYTRRIVIRRR